MSDPTCPFCPLVAALENADVHRGAFNTVTRRVALLPTSSRFSGTISTTPATRS